MRYSKLPDAQVLHDFLEYDPESGEMTWKERPRKYFSSDRLFNSTKVRLAGKLAFTCRGEHGFTGRLCGKSVRAARVAFKLMTGRDPKDQVDHINGDPFDNRWSNLREVSQEVNMRNRAHRHSAVNPYPGVRRLGRKWTATIGVSGQGWLGTFTDLEDALHARWQAEKRLGYHGNHGRYARK